MLLGRYVLDDADYETLTAGLTDLWRETWVFFNVADVEASYPFADALFNEIVDRSGPEIEVFDAWDPVIREQEIAEKGSYDYDSEEYLAANSLAVIDYMTSGTPPIIRNYWLIYAPVSGAGPERLRHHHGGVFDAVHGSSPSCALPPSSSSPSPGA